MRFEKKSIDYHLNLEMLHEMEELVPMTRKERDHIRNWVKRGHDLESNPWDCRDEHGYLLNYLQAYRLINGYCSGPWDNWKGPGIEPFWDSFGKCFFPEDELD